MDFIPLIDPGLTGLHDARPAGVFPFLAEGESIWIRGVASRPELEVGRGQRTVATICSDGMGTAANLLLFPGMVRRDFTSSGGSVVETVMAIPTLPLVVVQWEGSGEALPMSIVVLLHDVESGAWVTDEGSVIVDGHLNPGAADPVEAGAPPMEISLVPAATEVHVDVVDGVAQAVFRPAAAGHTSLVVALGESDGRRASTAAAKHAPSHAIRAAAGPAEGLRLATDVSEIDDAVAWLRVRLAGQARRLKVRDDETALDIGLAATAVGDRESSLAVLASMARDSVGRALLAARHAAVFGETSHARECALRWVGEAPPPSPLVPLAASELADALHLAGDTATESRLRALAAAEASVGPPAGGRPLPMSDRSLPMAGRSLPMAGRRPTRRAPSLALRTASATLLRGLLAGEPRSEADDPDAAWMAWREKLVDGSGRVVTLWDKQAAEGAPHRPREGGNPAGVGSSMTAQLLLDLASGILGLRADAAAGRIRIAPRLPGHLTHFEASGITVGSSTIKLRYTATPEVLRYELAPESAAVPPLVIFEPSMSGRPKEVRVDGEVAVLDCRETGDRTVVPVQLPLDARRVVEITR